MSAITLHNTAPAGYKEITIFKKTPKGDYVTDKATNKPKEFSCLQEKKTGDIYNDDPAYIVAIKCAILFFATPLIAIGVMAWNLCKIPIDLTRVTLLTLKNFGKWWKEKGPCSACVKSAKFFLEKTCKVLLQDLWHIVRAPIYCIGMQILTLIGIAFPFWARKKIAKLEYHWQDKIPLKYDIRELDKEEKTKFCPLLWKEEKKPQACYIAHCFQPLGNLKKDSNLILKK